MFEYKDVIDKKLCRLDFCYMLYWNFFVEIEVGIDIIFLFYIFDFEGEFKVVVEGFILKGELIRGEVNFYVKKWFGFKI